MEIIRVKLIGDNEEILVDCKIDNDTNYAAIRKDIAEKIGCLKELRNPPEIEVEGKTVKPLGVCFLSTEFDNVRTPREAIPVVEDLDYPFIIGGGFIHTYNIRKENGRYVMDYEPIIW